MKFIIRMGIPEMEELWNRLQSEYRSGTISKNDLILYKKWGKSLKLLSENPKHPSLQTHDIDALTNRYGIRVWQSYLENRKSKAMRMYWVYAPDKHSITIIGLEPHPDDKKNGSYERIILSNLPPVSSLGMSGAFPLLVHADYNHALFLLHPGTYNSALLMAM